MIYDYQFIVGGMTIRNIEPINGIDTVHTLCMVEHNLGNKT